MRRIEEKWGEKRIIEEKRKVFTAPGIGTGAAPGGMGQAGTPKLGEFLPKSEERSLC